MVRKKVEKPMVELKVRKKEPMMRKRKLLD